MFLDEYLELDGRVIPWECLTRSERFFIFVFKTSVFGLALLGLAVTFELHSGIISDVFGIGKPDFKNFWANPKCWGMSEWCVFAIILVEVWPFMMILGNVGGAEGLTFWEKMSAYVFNIFFFATNIHYAFAVLKQGRQLGIYWDAWIYGGMVIAPLINGFFLYRGLRNPVENTTRMWILGILALIGGISTWTQLPSCAACCGR
jgi:MFS family permease